MKKKEKKVSKNKKVEKKKKESLLKGVRQELKHVTWPSRKDIFKYSLSTLIFCVVIMVFFQCLDLILSLVKGVFN